MKHVSVVSKGMPAKALFTDDHPSIIDSILGFLADPLSVLINHIEYLLGKDQAS